MTDIPQRAQVVVIGGGAIGTSTAYHLTKLGITVAIERRGSAPPIIGSLRCS